MNYNYDEPLNVRIVRVKETVYIRAEDVVGMFVDFGMSEEKDVQWRIENWVEAIKSELELE